MPPFITFFLGLARLRGKREGGGRGDHSALFQKGKKGKQRESRFARTVLCCTSRTVFDGRETLFVSLPLCARPSPGPSLPPSLRPNRERRSLSQIKGRSRRRLMHPRTHPVQAGRGSLPPFRYSNVRRRNSSRHWNNCAGGLPQRNESGAPGGGSLRYEMYFKREVGRGASAAVITWPFSKALPSFPSRLLFPFIRLALIRRRV